MTSYVAVTGEIDVNQTYARSQSDGSTARLSGGAVVAVWRDYTAGVATGQTLKLRLIKPNGDPIGDEIKIVDLPNGGNGPSVAALADGGFAVSWLDPSGLHALMFDSTGAARTATLNLATAAPYWSLETTSSIAALAGGGFAVAWSDRRDLGLVGTQVHIAFLNASGAVVATNMQVNGLTSGNHIMPKATALAGGNVLVTWGEGNLNQIKARLYSASGAALGGDIDLTPVKGISGSPQVVALADGGFATVLSSQTIRRYDAQGVQVGNPIVTYFGNYVSGDGGGIVVLSDGGLAIAGLAYGKYGDADGSVVVQVFDPNGASTGEFRVNVGTLGDQDQPKLTALDNGAFMVSWTDHASGGDSIQVKSRIFAPSIAFQGDLSKMTALANTTQVGAVVAKSQTAGATLSYAIVGGADASLFSIDSKTGLLAFRSLQNYAIPTDAGADHIYDLIVRASDGTKSADGALRVTLQSAPTITSFGSADAASVVAPENAKAVATLAATDPKSQGLTWSIASGADAAKFAIDARTGALSFVSAPDYEKPADANRDNIYDVTVAVSDGTLTDTQVLHVAVTNVDEAPVISTWGGLSSVWAYTWENGLSQIGYAATDPEGKPMTWSLSGADAAKFRIDAKTGAFGFLAAPDYEKPADVNSDNVYDVNISVSDGVNVTTQAYHLAILNLNEAPVITSGGGGDFANYTISENQTQVATLGATDPDAGQTLRWSISGGADAALFKIDAQSGALSFAKAPDFEAPGDGNRDNVYDIVVAVSDGALLDSQTLHVAVTDVAETRVDWTNYADGAAQAHVYSSGTWAFGVAFASYSQHFTASGFNDDLTLYDSSGQVVAEQTISSDGSNTIYVGGRPYWTNYADKSYESRVYASGTWAFGVAFASYSQHFTASGFNDDLKLYDASGQVVAEQTFSPDGSNTMFVGGRPYWITHADKSYESRVYASGTWAFGVTYDSYSEHFTASGFRDDFKVYDASGQVAGEQTFSPDGSNTIYVGGRPYWTNYADKSYESRVYASGTWAFGVTYDSYSEHFTASGFRDDFKVYDASGQVAGEQTFSPDGSNTIYVGGRPYWTNYADKSYESRVYASGTWAFGVAFASYSQHFTASGFNDDLKLYDASGQVSAEQTFSPDGSNTMFVGGRPYWITHADKSYESRVYASGTWAFGVTYDSYSEHFTASGFRDDFKVYDASGQVAGEQTFSPDGSNTIYVGGRPYWTNYADKSYESRVYTSGTWAFGVAFASYSQHYTASGFMDDLKVYDALGQVAGEQKFTPDGSFVLDIGGSLALTKTVKAGGNYGLEYRFAASQNLTVSTYVYDGSDSLRALGNDYADNSGTLALYGSGGAVKAGPGSLSVKVETDVFALTPHALEKIDATGATGVAFDFSQVSSGGQAGWDINLSGFVATGTGHETLQFAASAFGASLGVSDQSASWEAMVALMTENSAGEAVINDLFSDSLTIAGVSKATLSDAMNAGDFRFV